jgi:hypothetical protein
MSALLRNPTAVKQFSQFGRHRNSIAELWERFTQDGSLSGIVVPGRLWSMWQKCARPGAELKYHGEPVSSQEYKAETWQGFSDKIWSFCLAAGCSKADRRDPFASLEALRDQISRQFAYTADLHRQIADLNKRIILQQRMITALAYRNVIENVSATVPRSRATDRWTMFVEQMFDKVEAEDELPADNPFKHLFDEEGIEKKYTIEHLKPMVKGLYSALSRTIHYFQPSGDFDQYTPMPGQYDQMEIDFLSGMRPIYVDGNNEPDWERERKRYPGHDGTGRHRLTPGIRTSSNDGQQSTARKKVAKAPKRRQKPQRGQEVSGTPKASSILTNLTSCSQVDWDEADRKSSTSSSEGRNIVFRKTDAVSDGDEETS